MTLLIPMLVQGSVPEPEISEF